MKYQFVILASDLQIVIDAHKEVGGYLEIIPDPEGKISMITFDNIDLLATEGLKVLEHSCIPVREPVEGSWSIKKEVIKVLNELCDCDNKDVSIDPHMHRVGIEFINHSENTRERIVTVNGKRLFSDCNTLGQYGKLNDPLRKLELWLFDIEMEALTFNKEG